MYKKYFIFALAILTLASCNPQKRREKFYTLNVGVMSSMDYLPLAVAKAYNYFDDAGVTVNLQKFYSANDRDAALQSKNLDGAILDYTGAAIQHAGGIELYLTSQCDGTFELMAGKDVLYEDAEDLKNKEYAVSRNTVVDFCTDLILKNSNISTGSISRSEINKIPLRLEMLRNGRIDMTVLPDPFATIAKADGAKSVASLEEMGHSVTGIVFTERALFRKIEAIQAFYEAYNRAIEDLQKKPIEEFKEILIEEIGFPEELIDQVKLPEYQKARQPKPDDLEVVGEWLKAKELIPADFNIFSIVTTTKIYSTRK